MEQFVRAHESLGESRLGPMLDLRRRGRVTEVEHIDVEVDEWVSRYTGTRKFSKLSV
jgi:hypothetical protein